MARVGAPLAGAADSTPLLRLAGISKRFGAVLANDAISLELRAGEVLALLGENGAGKSTLVSILFGHHVADAGTIEVDGRPLPRGEPKAALAAGIGMVHQHFTLADNLSVLDNVMLGTEPLWRWRSRRGEARVRLLQIAQRFGLQVEPEARVGDLSVGERQRVEILKALVRGARVMILDEPTAVLTPQESASLFATLQQLVAGGMAIVFISHKLDEVLAVADRVIVLRAGRVVAQMRTAGADKASLTTTQLEAFKMVLGKEVGAERDQAGRLVSSLATIGSVSPLLGLLGTVLGVMHAFLGMGQKGSGNIAAVAPGIAEALITTVAGIAAAIPALMAYNYFAGKTAQFEGDLDGFANGLVGWMAREGWL
ncbi:MAG: ATP-binding cassette domain-containing protein [Burkholderiaceae bacterium]|nr:MAG: ATP-binding cassette domain-containing protein [Burkholderiaceae bacterium]